jgi:hypothetical protein
LRVDPCSRFTCTNQCEQTNNIGYAKDGAGQVRKLDRLRFRPTQQHACSARDAINRRQDSCGDSVRRQLSHWAAMGIGMQTLFEQGLIGVVTERHGSADDSGPGEHYAD